MQQIPLCGLPSPLPDPSTVAIDLTRLRKHECRIYETPSAWSRGTPCLESGKPEEELYRKVRSILNKLTPQKFQSLTKQVQGLVIDTEARLKGVTDIIFEKAIREPAFSAVYAKLCRYLATIKVPSDTRPDHSVTFSVILLSRCQREFERNKDGHHDLDRKKEDKGEATNEEERESTAMNARRRSLGNTRLMGELFKLKMIKETIMHDCVFKQLRSRDEDNLECLCQLLTTIGKELETKKAKSRMDQYFQQIKKKTSDKNLSSRCRFMLQDVLELRNNNWQPRCVDESPKAMDQTHRGDKQETDQ